MGIIIIIQQVPKIPKNAVAIMFDDPTGSVPREKVRFEPGVPSCDMASKVGMVVFSIQGDVSIIVTL